MQRHGLADVMMRSREVRGMARRRKAASDGVIRRTERLLEASRACLARSRDTLERMARLERPVHARKEG